jgi:hypothetical protein
VIVPVHVAVAVDHHVERRRQRQSQRLRGLPRRGRRTSSPPQFGHTAVIAVAHVEQNVHSYEQM